ncbi:MAG: hypothetical protein COV74_07120 [Candidatus Omnitrophica bacterium CG11_big_fil_rev_8_21_14_0_20_45_26]|uniref:PpiC domain-containing protein n=1 Tax=Candidatus Abzuiibacterium crystallinum TaxID=1974748 RepID=A0A2H0LNB6_9BACT|nr:MAG: hypothetical protein COV74_07120 [Candidatus Omnitrophica bacterium CG11_big_fil_rev_8_21_14_0_20_45_26]
MIFFLGIVTYAPCVHADTFETRLGKTYEGTLLDEDSVNLYIDSPSGSVFTVRKMDVATINGEPYHYMGRGTAPVKADPDEELPYLGRMSDDERELSNLPKPGENVAVQFGSDTNAPVQQVQTKSGAADRVIHSSGVTEGQLEDYYNSHREEFRMPVQIRFKFLGPNNIKGSAESIARHPESAAGWQDTGWRKQGDTFNAPFTAEGYQKIFGIKKGEARTVQDGMGGQYIFWATERKESYILPYREARPKVLTKILQN